MHGYVVDGAHGYSSMAHTGLNTIKSGDTAVADRTILQNILEYRKDLRPRAFSSGRVKPISLCQAGSRVRDSRDSDGPVLVVFRLLGTLLKGMFCE